MKEYEFSYQIKNGLLIWNGNGEKVVLPISTIKGLVLSPKGKLRIYGSCDDFVLNVCNDSSLSIQIFKELLIEMEEI